MEPDLPQWDVLRYLRQVPVECLTVMVPECLRLVPDHTVTPTFGLKVEGGGKWIKVSNCTEFVQACRSFWNDYSSAGVQKVDLNAVVMPYISLDEAQKFHEFITDPDVLPCTWADSVEYSKLKDSLKQSGLEPDLGLNNLLNEDGDDEDAPEEDSREGTVGLPDLGVTVRFKCVNYSTLWSKAEKYCVFRFMSDSVNDMLSHLDICERLLHNPSADLHETFEEKVEEAKVKLIFAMYYNNVNPHDVIHQLFPSMHDGIYAPDCVHCDPRIEYDDKVDTPETMIRLFERLRDLGYDENVPQVSVKKVQMRLMAAQGHLEVYLQQMNSMKKFFDAHKLFKVALQPIPVEVLSACSQRTFMGASAMDINDEA